MKTNNTSNSNKDDDGKHNDENNDSTNQLLGYIIALLRYTRGLRQMEVCAAEVAVRHSKGSRRSYNGDKGMIVCDIVVVVDLDCDN